MINRREMLKSMGSIAGALGFGKIATATVDTPSAVTESFTNRISRYKQYEKFFGEHPEYLNDDVIKPIADEIFLETIVRPRCVFNKAKNEITLPGVDSKFVNLYFSPFKIKSIVFNCALYGDWFGEVVFDPSYPKPVLWHHLPCDSMYRIETIKGKLLEYQQSKDGPDYNSIVRYPIEKSDKGVVYLLSTALRFRPDRIVHVRCYREKYVMYGTSCFEQQKHGKSDGSLHLGKPTLDDQFVRDVTEGVRELVDRFQL